MKRHKLIVLWCGVFAGILFLNSARAAVRLPPVFGDHMVLQREIAIPIWGWADPGAKVNVKLADQDAQAVADTNGLWRVKLAPMKAASRPLILTVIAGTNTVAIQDVVIGDVWLCSGQSNMAMNLGACDSPEDIASADFPLIRQFPGYYNKEFQIPAIEPQTDLPGIWLACNKSVAMHFTAAGFYFARKVHQETGIPIGLINVGVGGSAINPWLTPEGLDSVAELKSLKDQRDGQLEAYRKAMREKLPEMEAYIGATHKALEENQPLRAPPQWPMHPYMVQLKGLHGFYNSLIHPLAPFAIKGVLWYQGETEGFEPNGDLYYHKMRALIGGWKAAWGQEFAFYYVQLAAYLSPSPNPAGGDGWAIVRSSQTKALSIPRTGMAVAIDIGDAKDVHPKNKKDLGERLALWALKNDYGQPKLECSGPLFREMKVEGNKARIFFDHIESGLMIGKKEGKAPVVEVKDGKLQRFAVAGEDRKWVWADATIEGDTVLVSSPAVPKPASVRYAYSMNPEGCNLYNRAGLPASPFRADNW